jgi:hypothetical protein
MDEETPRPACAACPACGGAGGGPFGRVGGAWDTDDYVCPRCEGLGFVVIGEDGVWPFSRPGVAKVSPQPSPGNKRAAGKA